MNKKLGIFGKLQIQIGELPLIDREITKKFLLRDDYQKQTENHYCQMPFA